MAFTLNVVTSLKRSHAKSKNVTTKMLIEMPILDYSTPGCQQPFVQGFKLNFPVRFDSVAFA